MNFNNLSNCNLFFLAEIN